MKKIYYSTEYDGSRTICGYVLPEERDDYYIINKRQYNRALENRTIGGVAGIVFHSDKPVYVVDEYGHVL